VRSIPSGGADAERGSRPPPSGALNIFSATKNVGSHRSGPVMSPRWSPVAAPAQIRLGRAVPGSCGVGATISEVSLSSPLDSPRKPGT
jgi:hypothetical protein